MTGSRSALQIVDLLAWSFVILSALGILAAGGQLVVLHGSSYAEQVQRAIHDLGLFDGVPPVVTALLTRLRLITVATLVLSVLTVIASAGVLKRREWARLTFIALMAVGIAWNLAGVWFQRALLSHLQLPGHPPPEIQARFETMREIMMGVSLGVVIAFSAAFAWTIWWMCRRDVVAAFRTSAGTPGDFAERR